MRFVVRQALGEDADHASIVEHGEHRLERRVVVDGPGRSCALRRARLAGLAVAIVASLDRHRPETSQHCTQQPTFEQRVLRSEVNLSPARRDDQDGIDQRVGMIACKQDRSGGRDMLETGDLDLAKEHACDDAQKPGQDAICHADSLTRAQLVMSKAVASNRRPAWRSRVSKAPPIATDGVWTPPAEVSGSCARQSADSPSILQVEP